MKYPGGNPCDVPDNFKSGKPTESTTEDTVPTPGEWPPTGHLKSADTEFYEALWNIPDGIRKGH